MWASAGDPELDPDRGRTAPWAPGGLGSRRNGIPVWAGLRGGRPGGSSLPHPHCFHAGGHPFHFLNSISRPQASSPGRHLPLGPPSGPARFHLRFVQPPSPTPGPARLPSSFPELSPLAVATEGLAGVPGTTPQRPALLGQSSGQSQSVWQGCGFRIGWSCPRLWEEGDARGGPGSSLKVTLLFSPSIPVQPLSLLSHLAERWQDAPWAEDRGAQGRGLFGVEGGGLLALIPSANIECLLYARH